MQATANIPTVMSSGSDNQGNLLSPPKFHASSDKLAWRKSVRYWALNVKACADGGDTRAKGVLFALAMILFRALPFAKQQALETYIDSGELSLDGDSSCDVQRKAVEKMIAVVAKDSASESIQRLARLSREAM